MKTIPFSQGLSIPAIRLHMAIEYRRTLALSPNQTTLLAADRLIADFEAECDQLDLFAKPTPQMENRFPTIHAWKAYVSQLMTPEQLSDAMAVLQRGKTEAGIHPFEAWNQMGLAIWHLDSRATTLDCYRVRDMTYRQYPQSPKKRT